MPVICRIPYPETCYPAKVLKQEMASFCEISRKISKWRPTRPDNFLLWPLKKKNVVVLWGRGNNASAIYCRLLKCIMIDHWEISKY